MRLFTLKTLRPVVLLLAVFAFATAAEMTTKEAGNRLTDKIGDFRATSPVAVSDLLPGEQLSFYSAVSPGKRKYESSKGDVVSATLFVTTSEASAYALLTKMGCSVVSSSDGAVTELGTKQCVSPAKLQFARGVVFMQLENEEGANADVLEDFARAIAPTLDAGEGKIPVLVKHLPGWPNVENKIFYAVTQPGLKEIVTNQPILDEVNFTGGAEAVVENYGTQRLMLIEFNTASLATDNDVRIKAKLSELRAQGQPAPTTYRRVGNYAVFVFDGTDEQTANLLVDQVKYQQVVQWLGHNPFSHEQATREFTETTLGVFVSVVKASGLALAATLAVGGFFGAMLFRFRRSQQRAREAYADSDAMLRLNIDELTPETDPARLLDAVKGKS